MPLYLWIVSVHHKCLLLIIIIILTVSVTMQHSCQERDCQGPSGTGPGGNEEGPMGERKPRGAQWDWVKGKGEGPRGKCPVGQEGKMMREPVGKRKGEGILVNDEGPSGKEKGRGYTCGGTKHNKSDNDCTTQQGSPCHIQH